MSGTRSPFPKAPAIEALIVAHGQPCDPSPAEQALAALAARVQARLPGARILSATLAAPGVLEGAVSRFARGFAVYPLFMAQGYFVTERLARRLAGTHARLMSPFGLDRGLVPLARRSVARAAAARGWALEETEVLLAAHGSARGRNAARAAQAFAEQLRPACPGGLHLGFVEEPPFVDEVIARLGPRALCLPYFAANGGHVSDDLAGAMTRAGRAGALLDPLGLLPGVPALVARALRAEVVTVGAVA